MNVKPGDVVYYEPENLDDIGSIQEAQNIDTACVVIQLPDANLAAVRLHPENVVGQYSMEDKSGPPLVKAKPDRFTEGWHRTQEEAIRVAWENARKIYQQWIDRLENSRQFLFPENKHGFKTEALLIQG